VPDSAWPNLFIVGAARAGTTSLAHHLSMHPDVFMSPVKEPHFFAEAGPSSFIPSIDPPIKDVGAYLRLFRDRGEATWAGEASTSYLWDPLCPERLYNASDGSARILIVLREPVARAHSHYLNNVRNGMETRSFADALDVEESLSEQRWGSDPTYIAGSLYAQPVARYLETFRRQVRIDFYEEMFRDLPRHFADICAFLDIPPFSGAMTSEPLNRFSTPQNRFVRRFMANDFARRSTRRLIPAGARASIKGMSLAQGDKPELDPRTAERLAARFQDDQAALREVLGRRLAWDPEA
jgi:Sulfotransferase domain